VNAHTELEADLRLQASSPAQDYRSGVGAPSGAETQLLRDSAAGGRIAEKREPAQGGQATDERVDKTRKKGGQTSDDGMSVNDNRGGQIAKEHENAQGGQVVGERVGKTGKKGGQPVNDGMSANSGGGGQTAQVIPLSSVHPNFRAWVGDPATPKNPALDDPISGQQPVDGQAVSWLKGLLPESHSGWWEVGDKGKGFSVRFRWRDTNRQTLLFPQIAGEEFIALRRSGPEEATGILRERISANLHSFLLNPAKRDRALIVAWKLGININPDEYKIASAER